MKFKLQKSSFLRLSAAMVMMTAIMLLPAQRAISEEAKPVKASFNFRNTPAENVLEGLSQLFEVQFVPELPLTTKITLSSGGPVGVDEMVSLLDLTLRHQGASARLEGGVVRIVPVSMASARVEMITLKYADPQEVAKVVLEIFRSQDMLSSLNKQNADFISKITGSLDAEKASLLWGKTTISAVAYPRLKAVVIHAPEAIIGDIKKFVASLDKPTPSVPAPPAPAPAPAPAPEPVKIEVFRPNYITAQYAFDMAGKLYGLSPMIEARSNSLIIKTNVYSQFDQMKEVLSLIDVPEASREQTFHITLNNTTANEVRNILSQLFSQSLRMPYSDEALESLTEDEKKQRVENTRQMLVAAGLDNSTVEQFIKANIGVPVGTIQIVADTSNNALLIQTNPRNMDTIRNIVQLLDQPKTQVFIKILIAEVTLDDTTEWGLDMFYKDTNGSTKQVFGMDFNADINQTGLTYSIISNNFEAFLRMIQTTTKIDILSTPNILTLDNTLGEVEFGKRVPLVQTTQVTDTGVTNSTVRYENVSTHLRVTPHVNAAGYVRMDIRQDINDISSDTFAITENLAPRILITRKAYTQVQVKDGQTVCLGGFIGDSIDESEEKVPILGDIPVIGYAFKRTKKTRVKNELLIFITPYILKTPDDLLAYTNSMREETFVSERINRAPELAPRHSPQKNPFTNRGKTTSKYIFRGKVPTTQPAMQQPTSQPDVDVPKQ